MLMDDREPKRVDYLVAVFLVIICVLIYVYYATVRGCGIRSTLNPNLHEYCECDGKVYGPMGFNCFSCDDVCATIKNYTVNEI